MSRPTTHDLVNRQLVVEYGAGENKPRPASTYDKHRETLTVEWSNPCKVAKPRTTHDAAVESLTQEWHIDHKEVEIASGALVVVVKKASGHLVRIEALSPGMGTISAWNDQEKVFDGEPLFMFTGPVKAGRVFEIDKDARHGIVVHVPENGPAIRVVFD